MRKRLFAGMIAVALMFGSVSVFAIKGADDLNHNTPNYDIKYFTETGIIKVSGYLQKTNASQPVTLTVFRPEKAPGDVLTDGSNIAELLTHVRSTVTKADGSFAFELQIDKRSGTYRFAVGSPDTPQPVVKNFIYVNPADATNAIADINAALSTGTAAEKLAHLDVALTAWCTPGHSAFSGVEYPPKFGTAAKQCELLMATYNDKGAFTTTNFSDIYNLQVINQVSENEVAAAYANYQGFLKLDTATKMYADYGKLTDVDQSDLLKKLFGQNFAGVDKIRAEFDDWVICYTLKELIFLSNAVPGILQKAKDELGWGIDTTKYTGQASINTKLIGELRTKEQIIAIANAGEATEPTPTPKPAPRGSGGGSYGKATTQITVGTGGIAQPTPTPEPAPDKPSSSQGTFSDLGEVSWAKDYIESLAEKNIVNGRADGRFVPNDSVTRAEFLKMLLEALKLTDETADTAFRDTDKNQWHYKYVATAQKLGITDGINENTFGVDMPITRQDMAVMVYRAASAAKLPLADKGSQTAFEDNALIQDYAAMGVRALVSTGVINGTGGNLFDPFSDSTRAQAATVICKIMNLR